MTNSSSAASEGRALYHAVWEVVGVNFFDRARLADWDSWNGRFDSLITDESTVLDYCRTMLASLKDPYTELVVSATPPAPHIASDSAEQVAEAAEPAPAVMSVLRPDNIGYLQILNFDSEDIFDRVQKAADKIAAADGIILDLRPNSGGRMHRAIQTAALFTTNGLLTTVAWSGSNGVKERRYYVTEDQFFCVEKSAGGTEHTETYERPKAVLAGKPLVVLLHRRTASAAEMLACSVVQNGVEGQTLTVGGTTAGKGIGQSQFDILAGKATVQITTSRWLAPGGDWVGDCGQTLAAGIESEIPVPMDRGPEGFQTALAQLRDRLGQKAA